MVKNLILLVLSIQCLSSSAADWNFEHIIIDDNGPKDPWVKSFGDIDGNGLLDIVIAGRGKDVFCYYAPAWEKLKIAESNYNTVDGECADVNNDGKLDIIIGGEVWFENDGILIDDPTCNRLFWKEHRISEMRTHDIEAADLDGDGDTDIVARDQSGFNHNAGNELHFWRNDGLDQWTYHKISCPHGEGLLLADIDQDGDLDIAASSRWYENTGSIVDGEWKETVISADWHEDTAIDTGDINQDGKPDAVYTRSEGEYKISWFEAPADPKQPNWQEHSIDLTLDFAHGVALGDMDGDGDLDVITAEMHQSKRDRVLIYENQDKGTKWVPHIIATTGLHNIQVADFNGDGKLDIMGANWSGEFQPIELWINNTE